LKKGAKVVTGGKRAAEGGSFFEPTVLTDVTTDIAITKEKNFRPARPLYRFKTDEAIKMANDAPTLTLPRLRVREGREPPPISTAATSAASGQCLGPRIRHRRHQRGHHLADSIGEIAPFGGMKESGIGPSGGSLGLEIRHRGIPRSQIPLHGRHRLLRAAPPRLARLDTRPPVPSPAGLA
jgi:succinate-semialdehyde dehydrogenase/glutarate-semialdehyde dehydrogenase